MSNSMAYMGHFFWDIEVPLKTYFTVYIYTLMLTGMQGNACNIVVQFVVQYVLDGFSRHSGRFSNSGWIQTLVQRKPHLALQTMTNVF